MASSRHYWLSLTFLIAVLLLSYGCSEDTSPTMEAAPDFSVALFDGETFQLGAYKGKPVLINFLASWCMPCREEIPILNQVYREYTTDVAFIAIAVGDTEEKAKKFVEELNLSFPAGIDRSGEIEEAYGVYGVPTTLFIDEKGIISYRHPGSVTERLLKHELDKIL
jgi:cytochrome c biogenesis protein CcmG/thiol:disulfide interchange protein DsbE